MYLASRLIVSLLKLSKLFAWLFGCHQASSTQTAALHLHLVTLVYRFTS